MKRSLKNYLLMKWILFSLILLSFIPLSQSQNDYRTLDEIKNYLMDLVDSNSEFASMEKLALSPGGHEVWLLKLGRGDEELSPGILLLAGADGSHPAGTHLLLGLSQRIAEQFQEKTGKDQYFYLVPVLNPDAYKQYHADLQYERLVNARETDIDRDGRISEDGYDDLDGNGMITLVRIEDPTGNFIPHEEDNRVMIPLEDRSKASTIYRLITEGVDNDKDGRFNEDGPGGINLNMNFAFNYPAFQPGAGEHAVSEEENRLLAEFLFKRWNIHTVFSFTRENNLTHPLVFDQNKVSSRIITGPFEGDAKIGQQVSQLYKRFLDGDSAPKMDQGPGSFSAWAYFHYGRFSFVSPGWWPGTVKIEDESGDEGSKGPGRNSNNSENYDLQFIQWADANGVDDFFVSWTEFDHPDFPGRKVEVGGFKPFVRHNPPPSFLDPVIDSHWVFLQAYQQKLPALEFQDVRVEQLESRIWRIRGRVVNVGDLPTSTELGDRTRWVRDIRNRILLSEGQKLLFGSERDFYKSLKPGEYFEFSWLVSGRGEVTLEVAHPMSFDDTIKIDLR